MKNLKKSAVHLLGGIAFVAALALVTAQTAAAQTDYPESAFGIKGGVNLTNFYKDNITDKNGLIGFNAGLYGRFVITEGIAIQPELLYTTRGAEATYNNLIGTSTNRSSVNLGYVQVPVLLVVNILPFLNIHAGPYASYLVTAKNKYQSGNTDFQNQLNKDNYNRLDYGLSGGIGVDVNKFHVGARYDYGLATVGKERTFAGQTYTFPNVKNSAAQVYVAFDLK